jgi:hypothetical protein
VDFQQQYDGREHVEHYLRFHEQRKLEMGGTFLVEDAGGMMVATKDVSQAELDTFAAADPAVQSGLLIYEIRLWLQPWSTNKVRYSHDPKADTY